MPVQDLQQGQFAIENNHDIGDNNPSAFCKFNVAAGNKIQMTITLTFTPDQFHPTTIGLPSTVPLRPDINDCTILYADGSNLIKSGTFAEVVTMAVMDDDLSLSLGLQLKGMKGKLSTDLFSDEEKVRENADENC